ncbi:hypothetical protein CLOSTHATH_01330 [Hungatella hathewayi DSM 13479]|jgi:hypothetical protein|uniref:Uncharacterized protein n=1 Tax=Hungatella hathewayi DSM 13479 TaxID=566550 RepID=D3ACK2_9FIRM|nr:hypothetical protein CLOSTHATH_01330 [Hungatella hathewayi DSM 13479]
MFPRISIQRPDPGCKKSKLVKLAGEEPVKISKGRLILLAGIRLGLVIFRNCAAISAA